MRITYVDVGPLTLVPEVALTVAYGSYPVFDYAMVQVHTDVGLVGLGEASPDPEVTGETQADVIAGLEAMSEVLVGADPRDLTALLTRAEEVAPGLPAALAAVDMALYDLAGKDVGLPVYRLLGGPVREGMRLYPVIPLDAPEVMAGMAARFAGAGYRELKVKVGGPLPGARVTPEAWRASPDIDLDAARIDAIAGAVGPDVALLLDVNQGWVRADVALQAMAQLSNHTIRWIEQPVDAADIAGLARVREVATVPIMADESCLSPADALAIVGAGAADIVNIKLMKCGGIARAREILAITRAAGVPCIVGSMLESSIGSAAGMHLVLSDPNIIACELIGPVFIEGDPAVGYPVDSATGFATVSDAPGLGVRLRGGEGGA